MLCSHILQQKLQQFLVLATQSEQVQLRNIVDLLIKLNSYDNHKTLCRGMQSCLKSIFNMNDCVVLFKDTTKE